MAKVRLPCSCFIKKFCFHGVGSNSAFQWDLWKGIFSGDLEGKSLDQILNADGKPHLGR